MFRPEIRRSLPGPADQHRLQGRELVLDLEEAGQIAGFAHHQTGPGVLDLVAQELADQGGVQRHADQGDLVGGDPGRDRIDIVVEHGHDRRPRRQTQVLKYVSEAVARAVERRIGMGLAAEVQEDLVGVRGDRPPQGRDRGVAEAGSPSLFHRADHRIHPFILGADALGRRLRSPASRRQSGAACSIPAAAPPHRGPDQASPDQDGN